MKRLLAEPAAVFRSVGGNRDVLRLQLAWAASNLASRASAVAVAVWPTRPTAWVRSGPSRPSASRAPIAAPWLGAVADRRPRRHVLLASDLARAGVFGGTAGLVAIDGPSVAVYVLAVVAAVAEPVFRSAQAALTPSLVSTPEELTAANVIASAVESVGLFAGPALGALLLVVTGTATVFVASAVVLSLSVVLVAAISVAGAPRPERSAESFGLFAGWRAIAASES